MTTRLPLHGLIAALASNACVIDRQLGETYDEKRSQELRLACEEEQPPAPEPEGYRTEPSGVAPCTPVVDLAESEKTAWCEWYAMTFHLWDGLQPSGGVVEDGSVVGGAQNHASLGDRHYCIQDIAVDDCRANLSISQCPAPLILVERCVRSMHEDFDRFAEWCAELLELESCATTIVQEEARTSNCPVPVE